MQVEACLKTEGPDVAFVARFGKALGCDWGDEPRVCSSGPFHHPRAGATVARGNNDHGTQRAKSLSKAGFFPSHYVSRISWQNQQEHAGDRCPLIIGSIPAPWLQT